MFTGHACDEGALSRKPEPSIAGRLGTDGRLPLLKLSPPSANRRQPRVARITRGERDMTIVRYEPWRLVNRFHRDFSRFFSDGVDETASLSWLPSVDVHEEENRFVVQVDLPGIDKKDIEITAEKGVLTIKGERAERGTFLRRFTLPENAQAEGISAKHTNGVLEVTIPKQPQVQPKRIEVQAA